MQGAQQLLIGSLELPRVGFFLRLDLLFQLCLLENQQLDRLRVDVALSVSTCKLELIRDQIFETFKARLSRVSSSWLCPIGDDHPSFVMLAYCTSHSIRVAHGGGRVGRHERTGLTDLPNTAK